MRSATAAAGLALLAACGKPGPPGPMTLPHCSGGVHDFAPPLQQQGPPNTPLDALVERIEAQSLYPDDPTLYDEWRERDLEVLYHYDSDHVQIRISIRDISNGRDIWAVEEEGICRDEPPPVDRS